MPDFDYRTLQGLWAEQPRRYEEIIAYAERCPPAHPSYALAQYVAGNAHLHLKRVRHSEPCFRRAVEAMPELAEAWGSLARAASARGDYLAAIECCERALGLRQLDWVEHNLGEAWMDHGRGLPLEQGRPFFTRATSLYRRQLEAGRNIEGASRNLACATSLAQGDPEEALRGLAACLAELGIGGRFDFVEGAWRFEAEGARASAILDDPDLGWLWTQRPRRLPRPLPWGANQAPSFDSARSRSRAAVPDFATRLGEQSPRRSQVLAALPPHIVAGVYSSWGFGIGVVEQTGDFVAALTLARDLEKLLRPRARTFEAFVAPIEAAPTPIETLRRSLGMQPGEWVVFEEGGEPFVELAADSREACRRLAQESECLLHLRCRPGQEGPRPEYFLAVIGAYLAGVWSLASR